MTLAARYISLRERTFKARPDYGLIETRTPSPSVPLFLRFYDRPRARLYELWRGLYNGRLISQFVVRDSGERIDLR